MHSDFLSEVIIRQYYNASFSKWQDQKHLQGTFFYYMIITVSHIFRRTRNRRTTHKKGFQMSDSIRTQVPNLYTGGKPYYSLDDYFKLRFGHKCYKIALNAHMSCPNRDGTLGTSGCIFCSSGGSGEFAADLRNSCVRKQLQEGKALFGSKNTGSHFVAYFQAYTNTYAPVDYLRDVYTQALSEPDVLGISIATRPDCLPDPVLDLLTELQQRFPEKFLWIELGLQTIHDRTAEFIRRGYPLSCFEESMEKLTARSIPVIVHLILGLPFETPEDMYQSVLYLNRQNIFGIKLQLLHVLKGTDLAQLYAGGAFNTMTKEQYLAVLIRCLELLRPDIVIHRVTGDGPKDTTIAPRWSLNKRDVLNSLHSLMRSHNTCQGKLYQELSGE